MPGTEVKIVFSISYSLNSSLFKIQTWQSNFMCKETAGNRINAGEIQNENRFFDFRIREKQKLKTDQI